MKVFISWSGEKSLRVAKELRNWLPNVVQASEPWVSDSDIEAGKPWREELYRHLGQSNFGIFCITSENQEKPWLMFEAGYLSNANEVSTIIPVLIDIGKNDLTKNGPLGSLQVVGCCQDDFEKLIEAICRNAKITSTQPIFEAFEKSWPNFQEKVNEILSDRNNTEPKRTSAEITWNALNGEGYDKLMQIYFGAVRDRISPVCQRALKHYQEDRKANMTEDLDVLKDRIRKCRHDLAPFRYQDEYVITSLEEDMPDERIAKLAKDKFKQLQNKFSRFVDCDCEDVQNQLFEFFDGIQTEQLKRIEEKRRNRGEKQKTISDN